MSTAAPTTATQALRLDLATASLEALVAAYGLLPRTCINRLAAVKAEIVARRAA